MHPVESTLYYSAAYVPCLWSGHPVLALGQGLYSSRKIPNFEILLMNPTVACIYDCAMGAWLGHDGFSWPGAGRHLLLVTVTEDIRRLLSYATP